MAKIIDKPTADLQRGDVVLFADLVDTVRHIELDGGVVTVHVIRRGQKTWWMAGVKSIQKVQVPNG